MHFSISHWFFFVREILDKCPWAIVTTFYWKRIKYCNKYWKGSQFHSKTILDYLYNLISIIHKHHSSSGSWQAAAPAWTSWCPGTRYSPSTGRTWPGEGQRRRCCPVIDVSHFRAPRDHVIQLVRNCREKVSLVVCQPPLDNVSCNLAPFFSLQNIQDSEDYKVYITG